ncbi:HD domain-containing protein [Paraburkholderia sediminicola]|uniref:HD domain-containing protein n=1 Tax=Paraburkholderia sediminicola TaxID=458836 RepID=UPI0038BA806B
MTVDLRTYKRISDPIHGIIELTRLESAIVSSKAFQRLHNVRQLGLAHYVFPAANYSRFAHSVGACHNAQRLLSAISKNSGRRISDKDVQLVRVAALVHDLGHYPFSHAFEHEIEEFYASAQLADGTSPTDQPDHAVFDHEAMGEQVLSFDPEVIAILKTFKVRPTEISNAFRKHPGNPLAGILSSDLDCDRLDYLRRTAHHSGLPYGNVDINYIIDQATRDAEGNFCFGKKAIRAADHLLVSRYFDYLQVPFHKSVVALEWSLRVVIRELLNRGKISCSADEMVSQVQDGKWRTFDDNSILHEARTLAHELATHRTRHRRDDGVLAHIAAILHRSPAKMIASYEAVSPSDVPTEIDATKIQGVIDDFRNRHQLCDLSLYLWKPKDFALIKASTRGVGPASMLLTGLTPDEPEYYERVRIDVPSQAAQPISNFKEALMHHIHDFRYRAFRVYALLNDNPKFETLVRQELVPALRDLNLQAA